MVQPVHKVRAGQVSAALWKNEISVNGRKVVTLKATVERRFKDKDGKWQSSGSFGRNEIPLAIYCLEKSFEHIIESQLEGREDGIIEEEVGA